MNRSIRYLLIFIILSICFYFLFLGFFGKNGYLYNKSLERMIDRLEVLIEKKSYEISSLNNYSSYLKSDEGIRDSAIGLGYFVAGDNYYLFTNGQLQDSIEIQFDDSDSKPFDYISNISCFLFSLGTSLLITLLSILFDYKKHAGDIENSKKENLNSSIDNFIQ